MNSDFISSIVNAVYPDYKNKEILVNNCKYSTPDGGCSKTYRSCPRLISDNMDLACGGACYTEDEPIEEDKEEEIE